jgi:hypothetical protein
MNDGGNLNNAQVKQGYVILTDCGYPVYAI